MESLSYKLILLEQFRERKRRNVAYSLSSFSKFLGVSAPSLSQIMSGKRPLSKQTARKILDRCGMSEEREMEFLNSAFGTSRLPKRNANSSDESFEELKPETFLAVNDWYYDAILSLGEISPNYSSPFWIAKQLKILPKEAAAAFNRLLKLGLVQRRGRGFRQVSKALSYPTRCHDLSLKKAHQQSLHKAQSALADDSAYLELFSSITMAVDERKLADARQLIKEFRRKLCRLLESGERQRVFTLAIQLFPVSKGKE